MKNSVKSAARAMEESNPDSRSRASVTPLEQDDVTHLGLDRGGDDILVVQKDFGRLAVAGDEDKLVHAAHRPAKCLRVIVIGVTRMELDHRDGRWRR